MPRAKNKNVEIEYSRRVKRIAVLFDDILIVDRGEFSLVLEFAEAAFFNNDAKIQVGLGANEIVGSERYGVADRRLRSRLRERDVADCCKHKARANLWCAPTATRCIRGGVRPRCRTGDDHAARLGQALHVPDRD